MNKNVKNLTALALSAVLVLGIGTAAVSAQSSAAPQHPAPRPSLTAAARPGAVNEKDETVYIFTDASGKPQKTLVSSWLKNPGQADILKDCADLHDIENVKGDETWIAGAGNSLSWNAGGADIYYQGISDRQAPVAVRISYTLDGKKVEPDQLAGRSGHVTIRFTYENRQTRTVAIDGKEEQIHVPFVMLTGLMLPTERFTNVQVTNATPRTAISLPKFSSLALVTCTLVNRSVESISPVSITKGTWICSSFPSMVTVRV